ncbi:NYN domain-containing protein [Candidatus Pacearchaeota archaeon]|nr:NYN domain-containing protein [Candidatus Pacearchaeota archaeon]
MEKVIVMIDAGFLSKVSRELGDGHYFKYDLLKFSKMLCGNHGSIFKHLFFYNAPPYQSNKPTEFEKKKKEEYDSFVSKLDLDECVTIKEGRCQRLRNNGKFIYKQKGVDTLLTMGLMDVPIKYPKVKQIILIASDSDFVPVIERLKDLGIEMILYTYFDRNRNSNFSRSNELIKSVSRYVKLRKEDFEGNKF